MNAHARLVRCEDLSKTIKCCISNSTFFCGNGVSASLRAPSFIKEICLMLTYVVMVTFDAMVCDSIPEHAVCFVFLQLGLKLWHPRRGISRVHTIFSLFQLSYFLLLAEF